VATYTWSRNLGLPGTWTDPTDRAADYQLLNLNRTQQLTTYGNFDLPFGKNRTLLKNANRWVDGVIGGWQLSWIGTVNSGSPNSITAATGLYYANDVPNFVGPPGSFNTKSGSVSWASGALQGNYFNNKYVKVADPQCSQIAASLQADCTLTAIALTSSPSTIVFDNPQPFTRGSFGQDTITNPGRWNVDAAMSKSFKVAEGKKFSVRVDAANVFNHQIPSNGYAVVSSRYSIANAPDFSMTSDGNPFGYVNEKVGNRSFQAKLRFDF